MVTAFYGGQMTSDAGAMVLGATDKQITLIERFCRLFHRLPGRRFDRAHGGEPGRAAGVRVRRARALEGRGPMQRCWWTIGMVGSNTGGVGTGVFPRRLVSALSPASSMFSPSGSSAKTSWWISSRWRLMISATAFCQMRVSRHLYGRLRKLPTEPSCRGF